MSDGAEGRQRRAYRRNKRFTVAQRVDMTEEMRDAIEREADAADSSLADVMRDCIERGLPLVRDARRKRTRSRART